MSNEIKCTPSALNEAIWKEIEAYGAAVYCSDDEPGVAARAREKIDAMLSRVEADRDRWLKWAADNQELHERASRACYERGKREAMGHPWRVLINEDGEPYAVDNGTSRRGVDVSGRVEHTANPIPELGARARGWNAAIEESARLADIEGGITGRSLARAIRARMTAQPLADAKDGDATRESIARYFEHMEIQEIDTMLSPDTRWWFGRAGSWVRNRLDEKWAAEVEQHTPHAPAQDGGTEK